MKKSKSDAFLFMGNQSISQVKQDMNEDYFTDRSDFIIF